MACFLMIWEKQISHLNMTVLETHHSSSVYGNFSPSTTIISLLRAISWTVFLLQILSLASLGHLESPSINVILTLLHLQYTSFHDDLEENPNI